MNVKRVLTVVCVGSKDRPHKPRGLGTYEQTDEGHWLPQHHGIRDGIQYWIAKAGMPSGTGPDLPRPAGPEAVDRPCPNHKCDVIFRCSHQKTVEVFDLWLATGRPEITVSQIEDGLQRLAERRRRHD